MATEVGGNLIEDSVVFGYDTNFGVANNNTAARFYPGEPAVNLFGDINNANARPNRTEYSTSDWTASFPKPPEDVGRVYSHTSGSLNSTWSGNSYGYTLIGYSYLANTSYTLSCWVYVSIDCNITAMHQSMEGTTLTNSTNRFYNLNNKGTWQQLSITCNSSSAVSGNAIIAYPSKSGVTDGSHTGFWAIGGAKLEINTHVTPYVLGTRSSTESLIDLRRTKDINVSNTSFDSSGQMNFDASDDQIIVDVDSIVRNADTITIEGIVNATVNSGGPWAIMTDHATSSDRDGFWWHYNIGGNVYFRVEDATAGEIGTTFGGSMPFVSNVNQHVVTVVGLNHVSVYVNGELEKSYTPNFRWNRIDSSKTAYLHIGRTFPGYYLAGEVPVFKMHNRRLTASEIKQNYQSYKKRFNL
jgi:hypothetical protein